MASHHPSRLLAVAAFATALSACTSRQDASRTLADPPASTYSRATFRVTVAGKAADLLPGASVSADFFRTSEVRPLLGRLFLDAEYQQGAPLVVVVSHALWQQRFASAPTAIGTSVLVDGRPATIVGVMSRGFAAPDGAVLWMPRSSPQ